MIGYLHGRVIALYTDHCLLDVHGVGYRVFVANSTRTKLRQREEASLFIYTSVREDAIVLYGFAAEEEYDLFLQLIGVSGIGPKVALSILSAITVEGLCRHPEQAGERPDEAARHRQEVGRAPDPRAQGQGRLQGQRGGGAPDHRE